MFLKKKKNIVIITYFKNKYQLIEEKEKEKRTLEM
jgi:hypothetical protein